MILSNKKGFGLIELMISILVASIIVAGLYQMLTSSMLNFGISSATGRSGKSARQVDNLVNNLIFQAGHMNYIRYLERTRFMAATSAFGSNTFFSNTDAWQKDVFIHGGPLFNGNNSIKFRFFGSSLRDDVRDDNGNTVANGYTFDCRGLSVPDTVELEMLIFVNDSGLVCAQHALHGDAAVWDIPVGAPQVIDGSIVSMRILYGTTRTGEGDAYFTAESVGDFWPFINLVKYSFVTSQETGQNVIKAQNTNNGRVELTLFDQNEISPSGPCPSAAFFEKSNMNYTGSRVCRNNTVSNDNMGKYVVPNDRTTRMHRIISGTVPLFNGSNFE